MKDEFHIQGQCEHGLIGTRVTDEGESEAIITPMPQGKPLIPGVEVIRAEPSGPSTLKLTSLYKVEGPPQVATKQYRENYDRIFGNDEKLN